MENTWRALHEHIYIQNNCSMAQVGISSLTVENPCSVLVHLGHQGARVGIFCIQFTEITQEAA